MIDWASVKTLMDEIGEEDFGDVVPLFLEEMDASVEGLAGAKSDGSLPDMLHFLKGSSLNLGFRHFSSMCVEGEAACKRGESDLVDVALLTATYRESRAQLIAGLASGIAA